jgi:ABC-type transport system involved in cytochrome c biogenesis permease component
MTFLPVVERELRTTARRRRTFWTRLIFASVAVMVVGVVTIFVGAFRANFGGEGGPVFRTLAVLAFGFALATGIFLTSDCLSEEKREGTLGLLFLTDLKGYDVVLGKLMATSVNAFYGLLAIFPVLAITLTMGGVTPGEFWRMVLVFLDALFLSLSIGMSVSSISRQDNRAMAGTLLLCC